MSDKLLPCPFCGGKAHVSRCTDDCRYSAIYCESCGLVAKWYHDYEDEAINHWNTMSREIRIDHCPVCQTLCEIKNCYEDKNIYRFEPLVSFTPTEIQFITNRLEELIEEWDVPDMVFTAHEILRKLEKQQLSSK